MRSASPGQRGSWGLHPSARNTPAHPQGLRTAGEGQVSAEACWPGLRRACSCLLGRGRGQRGRPLRRPCSESGQAKGALGRAAGLRAGGTLCCPLHVRVRGGRPLPGCLLFPPRHSSVAETAEGAVGSTTIPLAGPPTFGGCGSSVQLALASCSVPCPSAALLPAAAQRGCPARP